MYIWVGINIDEQLSEVKRASYDTERRIGFKNSNFTLPHHISLKISFPVDDGIYLDVIEKIEELYKSVKPFMINVSGIENHGNIVWIRMCECEPLNKIHDELNDMLLKNYGVGLHEYDTDYMFHTTLFMDDDCEKVNAAYEEIKDAFIPKALAADTFVIGTSPSGALGTYSIFRTVSLSQPKSNRF